MPATRLNTFNGNNSIQSNQIADGAITSAKIADNAIVTADINDSAVTRAKLSSDAVPTFRNRIINGDMRIAQRGTSFASSGYTIDRFYLGGSQTNLTLTQSSSSSATGFQNYIKVGRSTGTNTGTVNLAQAIESKNSADLAGNQITFSFYAKSGANFSSTSNQITIWVFSGTGDDQPASSAGAWTGNNTFISQNQQITSSWNRYSFTGTVPSDATQIGIQIYFTPVGTAGADDTFYITGVQLEEGSTATDFERRPYGTELALCQRYYYSAPSSTHGFPCPSTGGFSSIVTYYWKVSMRATPTITHTLNSSYNLASNSAQDTNTDLHSRQYVGSVQTNTTWSFANGGLIASAEL